MFAIPVPKLKHRDYVGATSDWQPAKLHTARRVMRACGTLDIECTCAREPDQLFTPRHPYRPHHGVEICIWPRPEGAEVLVLPDQRAQRCDTVCDTPPARAIVTLRLEIGRVVVGQEDCRLRIATGTSSPEATPP